MQHAALHARVKNTVVYDGSEGSKVRNSILISRNSNFILRKSVLTSRNFHYFYWVRILSITSDFPVSIIDSSLFICAIMEIT